jgi:TonB family protein
VHLGLDVVRRLRDAIDQAMRAADQDAEIGGLLLGEAERHDAALVTVDDFELFPSAHARGPSYTLAASERAALRKRVRQRAESAGRHAVGWFRTHKRAGLYMDQYDHTLMSELFSAPDEMALLIAPGPESKAGFFFWEDGDIRRQAPYATFPFDDAALSSGGHRLARRFDSHAVATAVALDQPRPTLARQPEPVLPPAAPASWFRPRVWVAGAAVAALMLASVVVARRAVSTGTPRAAAPAPSLVLHAERAEGGLKVSWNNRSRLIDSARTAVLHVTDGGHRYTLDLTPTQLRLGSMMYFANAPDVSFELVVSGPAGESRESLRTFAAVPPPEASRELTQEVPGLPPAGTPGALVATRPDGSPTALASRRPQKPRREPPRQFAGLRPAPASPEPAVPDFAPPPGLSPLPQAEQHASVNAFIGGSHPKASVTVRPASRSGLLGKIPLLRRLQRRPREDGDGFISARPVRRVEPVVPHGMENDRDVDVKVRIDEAGEVQDAEVLTKNAEGMLANAAVSAARDWRFEPAQQDGRDVPSEVVLRFHFQP